MKTPKYKHEISPEQLGASQMIVSVFLLAIAGGMVISLISNDGYTITPLSAFLIIFSMVFTFIIHEAIHGLFFKLFGAKRVRSLQVEDTQWAAHSCTQTTLFFRKYPKSAAKIE